MKALDFIKTISCPGTEDFQDIIGDIISEGVGALTPAKRKSIQNHVGKAMEFLLAEILDFDHTDISGADITCDKRKVIAEVKNRFNTLSGGKGGGRASITQEMKKLTLTPRYRNYKKYLVVVHPNSIGLERKISNAVTEISAAKFCKKFGVDFKEKYLELASITAAHYGVDVPEVTDYYDRVVFSTRKVSRRKKVKRLTNRT